jgi:formylglycine-generating enzyme required for sulfatase activity
MQDYALDKALVSNGDFLEFINDGGYQNFRWWFSEGWTAVNSEQWRAPLYWELHEGEWMIRDFAGLHPATSKKDEPVSHVSYFEASAFAKWAGKDSRPKRNGRRLRVMMHARNVRTAFPWGDTDPNSGNTNLFENDFWSVAPDRRFPGRRERLRLPADDRRRVGVDHFRLRAVPGIQVRV